MEASGLLAPAIFRHLSFPTGKYTAPRRRLHDGAEDYIQTSSNGAMPHRIMGTLFVPAFWLLFKALSKGAPRPSREFGGYRIGISTISSGIRQYPRSQGRNYRRCRPHVDSLVAAAALGDMPWQIASLQFYFLNLIALGWSYLRPRKSPKSNLMNSQLSRVEAAVFERSGLAGPLGW